MYRKSISATCSARVMSQISCQSGLPARFANRSQRALTTAAVARWMTPFSGPIQRSWLSPTKRAPRTHPCRRRARRSSGPRRVDGALPPPAYDLRAAADRECRAMPLEAVAGVVTDDDVRRGVVGVRVHRVDHPGCGTSGSRTSRTSSRVILVTPLTLQCADEDASCDEPLEGDRHDDHGRDHDDDQDRHRPPLWAARRVLCGDLERHRLAVALRP